jgi:hypothetical protein
VTGSALVSAKVYSPISIRENMDGRRHEPLFATISIRLYPALSASIRLYPPLSTSIHLYPPLSASIRLYPPLSASIRLYPPLSASIRLYPREGAVWMDSLNCRNTHLADGTETARIVSTR